jgi:hypothetical protein
MYWRNRGHMIALSRRRLLAAPAVLLAPLNFARPPERVARLRPGQPGQVGPVFLDPSGSGARTFHADGVPGAVSLPSPDARLVALLPIAGREIACIAFPADAPSGRLELMALAGWDGDALRLLGLEVLGWTGADGGTLSSRFAGVGDRTRLRIEREGATPRPGRTRQWENWTDYLAWRDHAPLAAALVRTPLPGTSQARLAALRDQTDALLPTSRQSVSPALLRAALTAFSPEGTASPPPPDRSMPPAGSRR